MPRAAGRRSRRALRRASGAAARRRRRAFPRALFRARARRASARRQRDARAPTSTRPSTISVCRSCSRRGTRAGTAAIRRGCCSVSRPRDDRAAARARRYRAAAARLRARRSALRVRRAAVVLAAAPHGDAPRAAPAAHADGAATRPRARLAAAPAAASERLTSTRAFAAPRAAALTIAALGARAPPWAIMDALVIKDLRKVYRNGVEALKGIDLTVREGDFFALLGPNGAGKTTAIGIVTSLIRKSGGSVTRVRPRPRARARCGEGLHRRRAARDQPEHVRAQRPHADQPGGLLRRAEKRRAGAHREIPEGAASLGQARRHRANAVGRHEAAPHDRARARARAAAPDPRRADGRRRHRDPPLDVGLHARDQRERHDDHPDDALPRGSREPLPQHRDHRRGPHHRERQRWRTSSASCSSRCSC